MLQVFLEYAISQISDPISTQILNVFIKFVSTVFNRS